MGQFSDDALRGRIPLLVFFTMVQNGTRIRINVDESNHTHFFVKTLSCNATLKYAMKLRRQYGANIYVHTISTFCGSKLHGLEVYCSLEEN